jgi:hypothetical protein
MRNVHVVCAGAAVLAAMVLTGCSKQEPPAAPPKEEAKKPMDDTPIIISDSGSKPGGDVGLPTSLSNTKAAFSSWPNNGTAGKGVTEIYPPFTKFTNIQITVGTNPPTTYCAGATQCSVECEVDSSGLKKISFQYDASKPHAFTLSSSSAHFNDFVNWASGLEITDPTAGNNIKNVKIGKDKIDCDKTTCAVMINAQ